MIVHAVDAYSPAQISAYALVESEPLAAARPHPLQRGFAAPVRLASAGDTAMLAAPWSASILPRTMPCRLGNSGGAGEEREEVVDACGGVVMLAASGPRPLLQASHDHAGHGVKFALLLALVLLSVYFAARSFSVVDQAETRY
jgi:hypothetical protein